MNWFSEKLAPEKTRKISYQQKLILGEIGIEKKVRKIGHLKIRNKKNWVWHLPRILDVYNIIILHFPIPLRTLPVELEWNVYPEVCLHTVLLPKSPSNAINVNFVSDEPVALLHFQWSHVTRSKGIPGSPDRTMCWYHSDTKQRAEPQEQTCNSALVANVASNNYHSRTGQSKWLCHRAITRLPFTFAFGGSGHRDCNDRHAAAHINYSRNPQLIAHTSLKTTCSNLPQCSHVRLRSYQYTPNLSTSAFHFVW